MFVYLCTLALKDKSVSRQFTRTYCTYIAVTLTLFFALIVPLLFWIVIIIATAMLPCVCLSVCVFVMDSFNLVHVCLLSFNVCGRPCLLRLMYVHLLYNKGVSRQHNINLPFCVAFLLCAAAENKSNSSSEK